MSTPTKPDSDPEFNAQSAISQSAQCSPIHIRLVPQLPDQTLVNFQLLRTAFEDIPPLLNNWEDLIVSLTENNLRQHETAPDPDHDAIFGSHTDYVQFCVNNRMSQRARLLWERRILQLVTASEARLQATKTATRIHKGAPLYNVGLCCFASGDFDTAYRYFAEAGSEDEKSGRGSRFKVPLGDHGLSEQVLINPLEKPLLSLWAVNYTAITGHTLDKPELLDLLSHLAKRPADAFQTVIALHRFRRSLAGIENEATQHIRVRATAELLVVLESTLKRQFSPTKKMLNDLLETALVANAKAKTAFDGFKAAFQSGPYAHSTPSAAVTNWVIGEGVKRIAAASTPAERIGNLCYLMRCLRNALMHELDPNVDLYVTRKTAEDVAGFVLAALRIAKHSEDATLAALP